MGDLEPSIEENSTSNEKSEGISNGTDTIESVAVKEDGDSTCLATQSISSRP